MNRNRPITTLKKNPINMICGLNMTSSHKAPKNPIVALLGEFGYSQNGGGTFFDFFLSLAIYPHNHKLKSESGGIVP